MSTRRALGAWLFMESRLGDCGRRGFIFISFAIYPVKKKKKKKKKIEGLPSGQLINIKTSNPFPCLSQGEGRNDVDDETNPASSFDVRGKARRSCLRQLTPHISFSTSAR